MAFLRFDGKCRDGAGVEALQGNRLAGLLAETVGTVFEPAQRGIDLGDQLALAVAGAQFELALSLGGGAVGEIGEGRGFGLKIEDRAATFAQDFLFPVHQLAAEIFALPLVHEGLAFRRLVARRNFRTHAHTLSKRFAPSPGARGYTGAHGSHQMESRAGLTQKFTYDTMG